MTLLELELPSRELARQALRAALQMQEDGELVVHDAALIEHDEVVATLDPLAYAAAVPSALIGALVGALVAGPVGLLVGGIVGAGSGALTARAAETGLPAHVVDELRRTCTHGNHAVALLVSDQQPGTAASFAMRCSALGRSTLLAC
jgi:uncharacterized membrane protein